jgi:hypothetical protein
VHHEFDQIAKKLWFLDGETVRLVKAMRREDRESVEQKLLALYGVSIDLSAPESDIKAALGGKIQHRV